MNPLSVLTARDVMQSGPSGGLQSVDAETPVRHVMELLRDGAGEVAVTEHGQTCGTIRAEAVMARLINPRGENPAH
jgi:glycine betaine/proline transport system ATP-binding protein